MYYVVRKILLAEGLKSIGLGTWVEAYMQCKTKWHQSQTTWDFNEKKGILERTTFSSA